MTYEEIAESRGWAEAYRQESYGFVLVCFVVSCIMLAIF
jgi:hypothetical protein